MFKNQLFYGDNLEILQKYIADESVDLCYIDPPFNTDEIYNQTYSTKHQKDHAQSQAFIDTWTWGSIAEEGYLQILSNEGNRFSRQTIKLVAGFREVLDKGGLLAYLVSMALRIAEIHRILKPTGSFYLHCDPTASHYLKILLDTIFIPKGGRFLNEITWKRKTGRGETNHKASRFGTCTDIIFFYAKSKKNMFHAQFNPEAKGYEDYIAKFFKNIDENGRRYQADNLASPSPRPNLIYEYKGYKPPKNGWAISKEKMEEWDKQGRLIFPKNSEGRIRRKRFLDELKGKPVQNLWDDIEMISAQSSERLGYPTQKPEALLERIIRTSSNEGDIILDAYCGCGTTIAVAEKLNRKWIGVDITYQSISLILKRLEDSFGTDFTKDVIDKETKQVKLPAKVQLSGVPQDLESARALANRRDDRLRKEFEKWIILTYSNNRAIINEKKGADKGIDGTAFILHNAKQEVKEVIFSVKSGALTTSQIRDLEGVISRESSAIGILLSLEEPTKSMYAEAKQAGTYQNELTEQKYDKLQIITVQEVLDGKRLSLPLALEVLKSAERKISNSEQTSIF